jgi:hypothetical protein
MPTINQLSGVSQVSGGDLLPVYVSNNGDARKVSITQLLQYFQQTFAAPTVATNLYTPRLWLQYHRPNANKRTAVDGVAACWNFSRRYGHATPEHWRARRHSGTGHHHPGNHQLYTVFERRSGSIWSAHDLGRKRILHHAFLPSNK